MNMRQFLLLFVFVCLFLSEVTLGQAVKLKDRTDWWSINNERLPPRGAEGKQ
jgi:hypothetical protein